MTQGNVKKPPVQAKKPTVTKPAAKPKQQQAAKQQATKQPPPKQQPKKMATATPTTTTTLPPPSEHEARRTTKAVIWQDDDDVDFEDITFALPIIISVLVLLVFLLRKYIRWNTPCPSDNRLDGKTVVITENRMRGSIRTTTHMKPSRQGGNTGMGKATATELAKRGAKVILGCRDKPKGDAVALMIRQKTNNQEVFCYHLDLASLSDVKSFVEDFNDRESSLHVLINNAAYMGPKATTVDHYERTFGVNFLGHFYLTYLLKDKLRRGSPSRIINIISDSYPKGKLNFDDLSMADYDIFKAYARSKLAVVILTQEFHRRFSPDIIFSYGVHPGCVNTELMRNWPGLTGNIMRAMSRILFKSPEEGCQTAVFCAVSDKLRNQSGKFYVNCSHMKIKAKAKEKEVGEKLWNTALHLVGLDADIVQPEHQDGGNPAVESIPSEESKKDK